MLFSTSFVILSLSRAGSAIFGRTDNNRGEPVRVSGAESLATVGLLACAIREVLITVFLFLTAPVSAHLIGKAALHRRCKSACGLPDDP